MVCSSVEAISILFLVREKLEKIIIFSSFAWVWKTCAQSGQCPFKTKIVDCSVDHNGYQTSVGPSVSADPFTVVNSKSTCIIARNSKSTAAAANGFTVKYCFFKNVENSLKTAVANEGM